MRWSDLAPTFPADMRAAGPRTLAAVRAGHFVPPQFCTIELTAPGGLIGSLQVACDALELGEPGDAVRVNVSARTAQAVADLLDLRLPTSKIVDAIDAAATWQIEPQLAPIASTRDAMVEHSRRIDAAIGRDPGPFVVSTAGKDWILHPRLLSADPAEPVPMRLRAINYGWHTSAPTSPQNVPGPKPSAGGGRPVWQTPGGRHDVDHVDRSQTLRLVKPLIFVERGGVGQVISLDAVLAHPVLSALVSYDGPAPPRYPFLPPCSPLADGGSCPGDEPPDTPPTLPATPVAASPGRRIVAAAGVVAVAGVLGYALSQWRP